MNVNPDRIVRISQAAEKAGFESIWAGGHPFLSEKQSRFPASTPMLDPIVSLTFIAASTHTIRLGTGIVLLPQFNPVILAKELSSLDVLSGGRLLVGIGVGWSEHEYQVLGLSYHDRGRRADEYLRVMENLWGKERPNYRGEFVSFAELQALPRPVQKPYPPIIVGGNSPGTFRRAVRMGKGWYGFSLNPEEAAHAISGLRDAAKKYPRPPELGELEITVTPRGQVDAKVAEQYAKLGVHRLVLTSPQTPEVVEVEQFIQNAKDTLIGWV